MNNTEYEKLVNFLDMNRKSIRRIALAHGIIGINHLIDFVKHMIITYVVLKDIVQEEETE